MKLNPSAADIVPVKSSAGEKNANGKYKRYLCRRKGAEANLSGIRVPEKLNKPKVKE